jgi:rubrerythrin
VSSSIAGEIILIFSAMFTIISIAAFWFAYSTSKQKHKKELQEKKMDIIDKHFNSMIRIECPYCKTIYTANANACPNCKANTKKILFPEIPTD